MLGVADKLTDPEETGFIYMIDRGLDSSLFYWLNSNICKEISSTSGLHE